MTQTLDVQAAFVPVDVRAAFVPRQQVLVAAILAGPPGVPGPAGGSTVTRASDTNLSGHRAVKAVLGGAVGYPSINAAADGALIEGITTGASMAGADAIVQISGEMIEAGWNWTLGPVFAGDNGVLTQSPPAGAWVRQIAVAIAPDKIIINLFPTVLTA